MPIRWLERHRGWTVAIVGLLVTFFGGWYTASIQADTKLAAQMQACEEQQRRLEAQLDALHTGLSLNGMPSGVSRMEFLRVTVRLESEVTDLASQVRQLRQQQRSKR